MITLTGSNYIGEKLSRQGTKTFSSYNPQKNDESNISFHQATEPEINEAMQKATQAFQLLKKMDDTQKALFLNELSKQIINLGDQLLETGEWETGLSLTRLTNERTRTCNQITLFADYIKQGDYVEAVIDHPKEEGKPDIRRMLIPLGPVLVFPASNFPFAFGVCGGDTVSAWAAGCPVVVKAHPSHPQTSELFAIAVTRAIKQVDFPCGMFSMIHANHPSLISKLIMHKDLEAIGFTGSLHAGRMIFDQACAREKPIPVFAEMGSVNPVMLFDDALSERMDYIAQMLADSITLGVGQFCTKPGVIFYPINNKNFPSILADYIKEKEGGIMLNKGLLINFNQTVVATKSADHIHVLTERTGETDNRGYPILFQTDCDSYRNNPDIQVEHFGPSAILVGYRTIVEMVQIISELDGQLTGTLFLSEKEYAQAHELISVLKDKVGRVILNGVPTGVEVCYAMHHSGPYPATTAAHTTSVGMFAIKRFLRPIAFQGMSDELLPYQLKNTNYSSILRLVNKQYSRNDIK